MNSSRTHQFDCLLSLSDHGSQHYIMLCCLYTCLVCVVLQWSVWYVLSRTALFGQWCYALSCLVCVVFYCPVWSVLSYTAMCRPVLSYTALSSADLYCLVLCFTGKYCLVLLINVLYYTVLYLPVLSVLCSPLLSCADFHSQPALLNSIVLILDSYVGLWCVVLYLGIPQITSDTVEQDTWQTI